MVNGYERWPMDVEKCTGMRVGNQQGSGCGSCMKVCPWSKPDTSFHRVVNWTIRHFSFTRRLAVWADDLMGYGKPNPKRKWWLSPEDSSV
jgi:ferredoxin